MEKFYKNLISDLIKQKQKKIFLKEVLEQTQDKPIENPAKSTNITVSGISIVDLIGLRKIKKLIEKYLNKRKALSISNLYSRAEEKFPTQNEIDTAISEYVSHDNLTKNEISKISNLIVENIVKKIGIRFKYNNEDKSTNLSNVLNVQHIESLFTNYILKNEFETVFGENGVVSDQISDVWSLSQSSDAKDAIKNIYKKYLEENGGDTSKITESDAAKYFNSLNLNSVRANIGKRGELKGILYRVTPPQKILNLFSNKIIEQYENNLLSAVGITEKIKINQEVEEKTLINVETATSADINGIKLKDFIELYERNISNEDNFINNLKGNQILRQNTRLTSGGAVSSNLIKIILYLCKRYKFDDKSIEHNSINNLQKYSNSKIENKIFRHVLKDTHTGENYFCNWLRSDHIKNEINFKIDRLSGTQDSVLKLSNDKLDLKNLLNLNSPEQIRKYYSDTSNIKDAISANLAKVIYFLIERIKNSDVNSEEINLPSKTISPLIFFSGDHDVYKNIINQYISSTVINENAFNQLILNHQEFTLKNQTNLSEATVEKYIEKYVLSDVKISIGDKILTLNDFLHLDHILEVGNKKITFKKFNIDRKENTFIKNFSTELIQKSIGLDEDEIKKLVEIGYFDSSSENTLHGILSHQIHTQIFNHENDKLNSKALIPLIIVKILLQTNEYILDLVRLYHSWDYEKNLNSFLIQNFKLLSDTDKNILSDNQISDEEKIEKIKNLRSGLVFTDPEILRKTFDGTTTVINENDIYARLGLNNQKQNHIEIFQHLVSKKDKTYFGKGEDLIILYLLGINIIESLKIIQNVSDDINLNTSSDSIAKLISKFKIYSGESASDDITFKPKLPDDLPAETNSLINNKVFEVKELTSIRAGLRTGSSGVAAVAKFLGDIFKILDLIKEFVNETKTNPYGKSIFSLVLLRFENSLPRNKFLDLSNKLKNFYIEFKDIIDEEESSERTRGDESSLSIENGAYSKEKINSLVELYINIKDALQYIIKSYHSGVPVEEEKLQKNIVSLRNINESDKRKSNVFILDDKKNKFNAQLPVKISSSDDMSNSIDFNVEDILELANKSDNRDNMIDYIFATGNSNEIHKIISRLAVKFHSDFSRITKEKIQLLLGKEFITAQECFKNVTGIFLFYNSSNSKSIIYVPNSKLNEILEFTSTSQHRPNFSLKIGTSVYRHFKNVIIES